ncbi:MAG: HDIG domain-containing protein [Gemmataceae bacterium]
MFRWIKDGRLGPWKDRLRKERQEDAPWRRLLADRDQLARLGLTALTVLGCALLAVWWGPPMTFRVGEVLPRDLRARVDFEVVNQLEQAKQNAAVDPRLSTDPPLVDRFQRRTVLVPRGEPIQDRQLSILQEEHTAYLKSLSISERTIRGAAMVLMFGMLSISIGLYVVRFQVGLAQSSQAVAGVAILVLLTLSLGLILDQAPWHAVLLPLTMTAMVLTLAYNPQFALVMSFALTLTINLMASGSVEKILVQLGGQATAILLMRSVRSRMRLVKTAAMAGGAYAAMTLASGILTGQTWSFIAADMFRHWLWGACSGFVLTGLLPFVERGFGVVTDISLLELADGTHPLMQELVKRAPGTYTHSLTVASLAESAAEAIGANPLLARVGSCFHDVGKMLKPQYFIENQQGENRHESLEPGLSTLVIIGHVKDGVALAEQYALPQPIVDAIAQHHGTTLVEYFYREALKLQASLGQSGDLEPCFRYPGPKPQCPETAIIMLADAAESTSRSMSNPTPASLGKMVHDLLMKRLLDGQFEESGLTLTDLHLIEESLSKSLIALFHARIKYPEPQSKAA